MNRTVECLLGTVALTAFVTGCSGSSASSGDGVTSEAKSSLARDMSPNVPAADQTALVSGNNTFAFDMYKAIGTGNSDNQFFSPYSISSALAMTYAGANGTTASEMASTLRFTLPSAQLHPAFDKVDLSLASDNQPSSSGGKPLALHVANSIWGENDMPFGKPFLDTLAVNYGAGMRLADFVNQPDPSRIAINNWVSDQTNAKITNLIPQGQITSDTKIVLVDAIYFDGNWATQFDAKSTQNGNFTTASGSAVSVPMMNNSEVPAKFGKGDGYEAVELPYVGNVSMDIVMPTAGTMTAFESSLTGDSFQTIVSGLKQAGEGGQVTMPKFSYHGDTISLKKVLQGLGMSTAFTSDADFSPMSSDKIWIGDVLHKAYLSVDEAGTEAAAATAVIGVGTAASTDPPPAINVNHAFFFALRDIPTNTILFAGRINDPSQQ
ncbi:MAG: serpin family protein [Polyangiaceae bacterium]